jgi:hypothetical protein
MKSERKARPSSRHVNESFKKPPAYRLPWISILVARMISQLPDPVAL